jgi:hypothetical protein
METKAKIHINDLPLATSIIKRINNSISTYAAAGINVEVVAFDGLTALVVIGQSNLINGYILNNKELHDRAKEIFSGIDVIKFKITPSVFSLNVDDITTQWIESKMEEFGVNRKDLVKQLAIDKSSLSLILSGHRELSKPMRATFFYYFLTYELNRDFRENI